MKNILTKLKVLAIAGIVMGLAQGAWAETEACTNCITFSADKPFGIYLQAGVRGQNQAPVVTLEWSTNQVDWSEYKQQDANNFATFTGYQAGLDASDGLYKLHIRGTNNTQFASVINSGRNANRFTNTVNSVAKKIACSGNAETLLDWKTVAKGEHPKMDKCAFCYMFTFMQTLTAAPDLPAINLSTNCYCQMFYRCSALTKAPAVLPATTLVQGCYQQMFKECTSLTKAPKIAAMNQAKSACSAMFNSANALKVPPKLRATNIVESCYQSMFQKTQIELKTTGTGKPWMIPAEAKASAAAVTKWSLSMFTNTLSEVSLQNTIEAGKQYYIASATPVTLTVTAVEGASTVAVVNDGDEVSGSSPYTVYENDDVSVTYTADKGLVFPDGKATWTTNFTAGADAITVAVPEGWEPAPRAPDYTEATGNDWLFNHAISGKECENEAAESSVDIFFIYPTLMTKIDPALQHDGFRLMDDLEMREKTVAGWTDSVTSAYDAFWKNARCLADLGHVYAPFYRQATNPHMIEQGTYANLTNMIYHGYGYLDITNALETYFTKWNKGRKFILAGHEQGSATLMLALEHYFTQDDTHKAYLKNLVASYQIGMGVGRAWIANLEKNTKTDGFDGVKFASTSNDVGVVISYNTTGEDGSGQSILFPGDAIAINPISWTTTDAKANKSLNLGSLTNATQDTDYIAPGLHSAKVNLARGTVEADGFGDADWIEPSDIFGGQCLHNQDYKAFWSNLRENNYVRAGKLAGFAKLSMPNLPDHVRVKSVNADGVAIAAIGGGYWAAAGADAVEVIVTPKDENPAVVFENGEREMPIAMKYEDGSWVSAMSDAEIAAATKSSDTPTVQLGIVAQRYPWNGTLDIQYKTLYANASVTVTFKANGTVIGTAKGTGGEVKTTSIDFTTAAEGAFKEKALKNVKITATIE